MSVFLCLYTFCAFSFYYFITYRDRFLDYVGEKTSKSARDLARTLDLLTESPVIAHETEANTKMRSLKLLWRCSGVLVRMEERKLTTQAISLARTLFT